MSYIWDIGPNAKCFCCNKTILNPVLHHKDGNHFNNLANNRIALCKTCHNAVHHNIDVPTRKRKTGLRRINIIDKKTKDKIIELKEGLTNGKKR